MLFRDSAYSSAGKSFFYSAARILIIINIVVFVFVHVLRSLPLVGWLGLVPQLALGRLFIWQFVTHLFVHAGLWHLVINMLILWMFGEGLEGAWGSRRFLLFFFLSGIAAGLCSALLGLLAGTTYPILGASGAIFGLLVAYAVLFPEQIILVFFLFPMKMRYAVLVFGGINILASISSPGSGPVYLGQLGGGLAAYMYLKNERLRFFLEHWSPGAVRERVKEQKQQQQRQSREELDREVDRILDKISTQGMESLTGREREILNKKSHSV